MRSFQPGPRRPRFGAALASLALAVTAFVAAARVTDTGTPEPKLPTVLLRALDAGDADAIGKLFVDDPLLFVLDRRDQPIRLDGAAAVRSMVEAWGPTDEQSSDTRLLSTQLVSTGTDVRIFAFEFERRGEPTRRFRATLCAELRGEEDARVLQAFHLHVSSADREDY